MDLDAEADLAIVNLPMCNLYLMDRGVGLRRAGVA
jgi:hypothetical protein